MGTCVLEVKWTHPFPDEGKEPEVIYSGGEPMLLQGCGSSASVSACGGYHVGVGGIVGDMSWPKATGREIPEEARCQVENCWSTATVSASGVGFQSDCGGIVGQIDEGMVRGCWASPTVFIATSSTFQNTGSIAGCLSESARVQDCWGNASGCQVSEGREHCGGIVGRMWGSVSNCWVLGAEGFAPENAISFASWTFGPVTGCGDMTALSPEERKAFLDTCGWDFETVWDRSGAYPILRGCDAAPQREAQGGKSLFAAEKASSGGKLAARKADGWD